MSSHKDNRFKYYIWKNVSGKENEGKNCNSQPRGIQNSTIQELICSHHQARTAFGTADCSREKKKNENSRKKDDEYR